MPDTSQNWQSGRPLSAEFSALIEEDELAKKHRARLERNPAAAASASAGHFIENTVHNAARKRAETKLLQMLISGKFSAFGFKARSLGSRLPVEIPIQFWNEAIIMPDEDRAQSGPDEFHRITVQRSKSASHTRSATSGRKGIGGRPNQKERAKEEIRKALKEPDFVSAKNRMVQAREIRVRLNDGRELYRTLDDMAGLKTETIARWIGEVLAE